MIDQDSKFGADTASAKFGFLSTLLIAILLFSAGCVSQRVGDLIETTNALLVSESAGQEVVMADNFAVSGPDIQSRWIGVVNDIDETINRVKGNNAIVNGLRLRKALVLTHAKQFNLAQATFDRIEPTQLSNSRDRAIHAVGRPFVWWNSIGPSRASLLTNGERQDGKAHLTTIDSVIATLDPDSSVGDYLTELRCWIQLKVASAETRDPLVLKGLNTGVSAFETRTSVDEGKWVLELLNGTTPRFPQNAIDRLRWVYGVKALVTAYAWAYRKNGSVLPATGWSQPWVIEALQAAQ